MPHPHGSDCRCPKTLPADAGLLAFTVDCDHFEQLAAALEHASGTVTLRVLTTDLAPANLVELPAKRGCSGEMTCGCEGCARERQRRMREGVRRPRQPWEAQPSRRRAA